MQRERQQSIASVSSTASYASISTQSTTDTIDWRHGTPPRDPNRFGFGVDFDAIMRLPQPPYRDPFNHTFPPAIMGDGSSSPMLWGPGPSQWEEFSQLWETEQLGARDNASVAGPQAQGVGSLPESSSRKGAKAAPKKNGDGPSVSPTRRSARQAVPRRPMEPSPITISPSRSKRTAASGSSTSAPKASSRRGTKEVAQQAGSSASLGSSARGGVTRRKSRK